MLIQQLEPLAEQQIMGMYGLRHSSQQAEEALSQGLEQLQQSLVDTVAGAPLVDGVQQMVVAMSKLANLEGFVRQVVYSFTIILLLSLIVFFRLKYNNKCSCGRHLYCVCCINFFLTNDDLYQN